MNLDAVTAELRPRGPWEAVDFGARMVRRDAAVIYRVWFVTTLPMLALATFGIVYLDNPTWAQIGYWWLEPIVDAPILYIISRRLFGEKTDARTALKEVPRLAVRNWVFLLTPLRFHFARSIAMPLVQLEQLKGARRRARAKVMNQVTLNHGIGVTAAYQHLILSIYFGIILLGYMFIPEAYRDTVGLSWFGEFWESDSTSAHLLGLYVGYIAQSALQPWFVGAGFGLYINCRTILEAWDVEVAFRRMLQRRSKRIGAAAAMLLLAFCVVPQAVQADEETIPAWWDEQTIENAVKTVYDDESMKTVETRESWQSIDEEAEEEANERDFSGLERFIRAIGKFFALLVEFGLWIVAGLLLAVLVITYKRWLPYLSFDRPERRRRRRVVLATGEITRESLPDDLPGTVMSLWREGKARDALSLLYRGSVFCAVDQHGVRLPKSATEGGCLSAVETQSAKPHADFFGRVVMSWSWCAYGARPPSDDVVAELCSEWPRHYGATA